jgi:hypothetical protein
MMYRRLHSGIAVAAVLAVASVAAGQLTSPDGSLTSTGSPWGWEYGGDAAPYHIQNVNLTTLNGGDPVALRGWVDLTDTPEPTGQSKYFFSWHATHIPDESWSDRTELKTNFASAVLGNWYGLDSRPWERVRLEQTALDTAPTGEEWYVLEGGTHDIGGGGPIYPTDQTYYFQTIIDPDDGASELWVYANGNSGDVGPPNSINSTPDKEWYRVATGNTAPMDLTDVTFWPLLFNSDLIGSEETTTVSWYDITVGEPLPLDAAPPAIPEPATMSLLGLGGLGVLLRRRRKA